MSVLRSGDTTMGKIRRGGEECGAVTRSQRHLAAIRQSDFAGHAQQVKVGVFD